MKFNKLSHKFGISLVGLAMSLGVNAMNPQLGQQEAQQQQEQACPAQQQQACPEQQQQACPAPQQQQQQQQQVGKVKVPRAMKKTEASSSGSHSSCSSSEDCTPDALIRAVDGHEFNAQRVKKDCKGNVTSTECVDANVANINNWSSYVDSRTMKPVPAIVPAASFDGHRIVENMVVSDWEWSGCLRNNIDWSKVSFHNTSFKAPISHYVNVKGAHFSNVVYLGGVMSNWNFKGADLRKVWINTELRNVSFKRAYLEDVNFSGSTMTNSDWRKKGVSFKKAKLVNVHFDATVMKHVNFKHATFIVKSLNDPQTTFVIGSHFPAKRFVGARLECNGVTRKISKQDAYRLKAETFKGQKTVTAQQIFQNVQTPTQKTF